MQLGHGLAVGESGLSSAEVGQGGVGGHGGKLGGLVAGLCLEGINLGGVAVKLVGQLGVVGGGGNVLLPAGDLVARVDGVLVGGNDGAALHQGAVGREGGKLSLLVGDLCLEGVNGGLVVVKLVGEPGVVGGELGLAGELGYLGALGLDAGGAILVTLGGDGSSQDEGDEDVGDLHFC